METKYDSGIAAYDTDIDFIWRMTRRAFGIKRNGKLYKIQKVKYDNKKILQIKLLPLIKMNRLDYWIYRKVGTKLSITVMRDMCQRTV